MAIPLERMIASANTTEQAIFLKFINSIATSAPPHTSQALFNDVTIPEMNATMHRIKAKRKWSLFSKELSIIVFKYGLIFLGDEGVWKISWFENITTSTISDSEVKFTGKTSSNHKNSEERNFTYLPDPERQNAFNTFVCALQNAIKDYIKVPGSDATIFNGYDKPGMCRQSGGRRKTKRSKRTRRNKKCKRRTRRS